MSSKARRGNPNLVPYSAEEDAAIRRLWPRSYVQEIEDALPGRTMTNLRARAMQLGVRCEGRPRRHAAEAKPRPVPARCVPPPARTKGPARTAGVVVTAAEICRLPLSHAGRQAWMAGARISGPAAQSAWQQWLASQQDIAAAA